MTRLLPLQGQSPTFMRRYGLGWLFANTCARDFSQRLESPRWTLPNRHYVRGVSPCPESTLEPAPTYLFPGRIPRFSPSRCGDGLSKLSPLSLASRPDLRLQRRFRWPLLRVG